MNRLLLVLVSFAFTLGSRASAAEQRVYAEPSERKGVQEYTVDKTSSKLTFTMRGLWKSSVNGKPLYLGAREGIKVVFEGPTAKKWIALDSISKDGKTMSPGGLLKSHPLLPFKLNGDEVIVGVHRFEYGCIFFTPKSAVALDWQAVKEWENGGGYKKLGLPKKDKYRAWHKLAPSPSQLPPPKSTPI